MNELTSNLSHEKVSEKCFTSRKYYCWKEEVRLWQRSIWRDMEKKVENERWEKETQKQKEKSENSLLKQIENNELIVGKNPSETASNIFLPFLSYFNNKTITTK